MVLPFLMLAVLFQAIQSFVMFDLVNLLTSGGPGSTTELVSITLKRAAFEKWETGYASALAVTLFVTIFGAANVYVRALNWVKHQGARLRRPAPSPSRRRSRAGSPPWWSSSTRWSQFCRSPGSARRPS